MTSHDDLEARLAEKLDPPWAWSVDIAGARHEVTFEEDDVVVDGEAMELSMEYAPGDRIVHAEVDGEDISVRIEATRTGLKMTTRGAIHKVSILPARIAHLTQHMLEKIPPDLSRARRPGRTSPSRRRTRASG